MGDPDPSRARPAITVGATGLAAGRPDVVHLGLGVETRADTPGRAFGEALAAGATLVRLVERRGVPPEDRRTTDISVTAVFDHQRQVVSGHQAVYLLTVRVPDIVTAGAILDDAADDDDLARVLRVHSITFSFDDPEPLRSAARAAAVASARRRAEELAAAAGVGLGPVRSIVESDSGFAPVMVMRPQRMREASAAVESGTHQVAVQVTITFDIAG